MTRFRSPYAASGLAALLCLVVYLRALSCGFVNFDDPSYVLNNEPIRKLGSDLLIWSFGSAHASYWMPLTWVSFAVDYHFWGLDPFGYHLTNIVLHTVNTGLVVLIADRILLYNTEQRSSGEEHAAQINVLRGRDNRSYAFSLLLAGLLWGLHPLRVESVAWVTERKDVLNGLFTFSSVLAYLRFTRLRDEGGLALPAYVLTIVLFACSLMAKSVSVVLPVMLLAIDWYPLKRLKLRSFPDLVFEKTPFLLLSAGMSFMTVALMKDSGCLVSYEVFPLGQRALVSGNAVFEYLRLIVFPVKILPLYVFPNPLPPTFAITTTVALLGILGCLAAVKKVPWLPVVMICFLLPLLPTLAFFQNGDQILAARFTYLPAVALSLGASALFNRIWHQIEGVAFQRLLSAVAVVVVLTYAGISFHLIGYWKDTGTYWSRIIEISPIGRAYSDRGRFYLETGDFSKAVPDLTMAAEIATQVGMPEVFNIYALRGVALAALGRHDEAVRDFSSAIALYPARSYYYNRGLSLLALGRNLEASGDFEKAGTDPGPVMWYKAP